MYVGSGTASHIFTLAVLHTRYAGQWIVSSTSRSTHSSVAKLFILDQPAAASYDTIYP
jgi:hypothetical protein